MKHHKLDIKPEPEEVLYVNEPELIDRSLFCSMPYKPKEQIDNIRVYVPLDLNKEAILRRLEDVISIFEEATWDNETSFSVTVAMLIGQIEIYDHIWAVRNDLDEGIHSKEAIELVKEFIKILEDIPDGCADSFPFDMIDELKEEYL